LNFPTEEILIRFSSLIISCGNTWVKCHLGHQLIIIPNTTYEFRVNQRRRQRTLETSQHNGEKAIGMAKISLH
jgi:hypothetical protein